MKRSQRVNEFLQTHACLSQHALKRLWQNRVVIRNCDANRAFAETNVRTSLVNEIKTQSLQGANRFFAGYVPWKFHVVASTASLRNRSRMCRGIAPLSKWHSTASRTFFSSSPKSFPCVVMPPPWFGASQLAVSQPLSSSRSTVNVIS